MDEGRCLFCTCADINSHCSECPEYIPEDSQDIVKFDLVSIIEESLLKEREKSAMLEDALSQTRNRCSIAINSGGYPQCEDCFVCQGLKQLREE